MTTTRPPRSTGPDRRPSAVRAEGSAPVAVVGVRRLFAAEHLDYFLILGTTIFLVAVGLVMVLSATSIEEFAVSGDFFAVFVRQLVFAAVGVPLMLLVSRLPVSFFKRWAWHGVVVALGLQFLVVATGLGKEVNGNTNWLDLGFMTMQPSEVGKLALVVWLAHILTLKRDVLHDWRELALPIAPVAGGAIALVLAGSDLGTAIIMLGLVLGALFFAGVRARHLAFVVVAVAVLGAFAVQASDSRLARISAWLEGYPDETYTLLGWQPQHGLWALAAGGLFGQGLGNSKAKWSWLPEAGNDFIFAIIGEELGLVGAVVVLLLFVVLAIGFVRVIRRENDPFARVATGAVLLWIIGQAFVNIGVVLGVLPVLGVPLPLISAGGTALITTLLGIGIVLSFARRQGRSE